MSGIDEAARVEAALRELISEVDYDLHKQIECDEEDGTNHYPGLAANFIKHVEAKTRDTADYLQEKLDALGGWADAMIADSNSPQYGRDVRSLIDTPNEEWRNL